MIILLVSFYLGIKKNMIYSIPAMLVFVLFMFVGMALENTRLSTYYTNMDTLGFLLNIRKKSKEKMRMISPISKKALKIVEILKEGEANQAILLKKLKNGGTPLSEKTLRKYLNNDLKEIVAYKKGAIDSISRRQKDTKVYYIKTGN